MKLINRAVVLSIMVMVVTSCSFIAAVPTHTVMPISTKMLEPTRTQTVTPTPQYTKTAKPSSVVDTQDGKLFISHVYGFSILLPSDSQGVVYNRAEYLPEILSADLSQILLDDGGQIFAQIRIIVEEHVDKCHSWALSDPTMPIKVEQVTIGGNSYTKLYTTVVDRDSMQYIDYMTYRTDFCVHFWIPLTTSYFDRPIDAQPPRDLLPYKHEELDKIISTLQWVNP